MDNQENGSDQNRKYTDAELGREMISMNGEYLAIVERIESAKSDQKRDILRDLTNTGLAILGGALTIITVGSQFIRTPTALYIGMGLVGAAILGAYIVRIQIGRRYSRVIERQYTDYHTRAGAARNMIFHENRDKALVELDISTKNTPFAKDGFPKRLDVSEIVIGIVLAVGSILVAVGITLVVSIHL